MDAHALGIMFDRGTHANIRVFDTSEQLNPKKVKMYEKEKVDPRKKLMQFADLEYELPRRSKSLERIQD